MAHSSSRQVLIIGAGPVGLCTGLELRRLGFEVTLVDSGKRGAGWASGGMLAPLYEFVAEPDLAPAFTDFAFQSARLWRALASELHLDLQRGSVIVARDAQEERHLIHLSTQAQANGYPMQEIALPDGLVGHAAYQAKDEACLEPRKALEHLKRAFLERGGNFVVGEVAAIGTNGVTLTHGGVLDADTVIIANGFAAARFGSEIAELASLSPVKGQMARVGMKADFEGTIRAGRVYLLARGDSVVIGATSDRGGVTTGDIDLDPLMNLLAEASDLCPRIRKNPVIEAWSGIRPDTPDHRPLVGGTKRDNVYLACGTYRNGWLLAPGIARMLGAELCGQDQDFELQVLFAPARFRR
jgi:glycine oxidase